MAIRPATDEDTTKSLDLLTITPNPPSENEETLRERFNDPNQVIYVDEDNNTLCALAIEDMFIRVVWWLWDGVGDQTKLLDVLKAALERVLEIRPDLIDHRIGGDLFEQNAANNTQILFPNIVDVSVSPLNPNLWRAEANTRDIITRLRSLQVVGRGPR